MEKNNSFIKYGESITPKPQGIDYELQVGKVYTLVSDPYGGDLHLKEDDDFIMPKKYYQSDADKRFCNKVVNTFKGTEKLTTGVLLSGLKGCGKTLMAKHIATMAGTPIIVVDKNVRSSDIENFFSRISIDVCVIFDELDKYWNTSYLLGFFDGVKPTGKKLVICTCNEESEVSDYLSDRCSRIRYKRNFECLTLDATLGILTDLLDEDKAIDVASFISENVGVVSYDNVIVFAEEVKNNPDVSLDEIFEDLNIEKK